MPFPALELQRRTLAGVRQKRNDPADFSHAFPDANQGVHSSTDGDRRQSSMGFERTARQQHAITTPIRQGASSNAYLPSSTPCPFVCRAYARKPKGTGLVTRGRTAGLPRRNQTDPARHLTWQDLGAVYDALTFADDQGTPLTAFLTINWRTASGFNGDDAASWSHHHTRVTEAMKKWLERRGVPAAFAFVRERCRGPGGHTHFLLHLPGERWATLTVALERHLYDAGGFTEASAVHITRSSTPGMIRRKQRLGVLQYVAKGINPAELVPGIGGVLLSTFLGITPKPQVPIPCKRVGCSTSIGPGTRRQAGYTDTDDVLRLASSLPLK